MHNRRLRLRDATPDATSTARARRDAKCTGHDPRRGGCDVGAVPVQLNASEHRIRHITSVVVTYPFANLGPRVYDDVQQSLDSLRRVPGVLTVGATPGPLVNNAQSRWTVGISGQNAFVGGASVTPDFFEAAGIELMRGRQLSAVDDRWRAVIVNNKFLRAFWPGTDGLTQVISSGKYQASVVGVVRATFDTRLDIKPTPMIYALLDRDSLFPNLVYVLRSTAPAEDLHPAVRRTIFAVNSNAIVESIDTLGHRLSSTVNERSFATLVLALFGVAGSIVAIAGLVGMVMFTVSRRTREMAIRRTLGASHAHIRRLIVGEAIAAAMIGGLPGMVIGRWLSTGLKSLVYGIDAGNWSTALGGGAALLFLMVSSAWMAGERALVRQPSESLRFE